MKSKGYPNNTCLAHGVGGALLGVFWIIFVLVKKNYDEVTSSSQLSDMELLSKMMDLKERGAITESEFEEKKREILNSVKKNNNPVNRPVVQVNALRTETAVLFCVAFFIGGIAWFLSVSDFLFKIGYEGNLFELYWLKYDVVACAIMTIMLLIKVDIRFLGIPLIVELLPFFQGCYNIIVDLLSTESNHQLAAYKLFIIYISLILSTAFMFVLIFYAKKTEKHQLPLILYTAPGISRIIYAIDIFMTIPLNSFHIEIDEFWVSLIQLLGGGKVILSVAYIMLGIMIKRMADEKSMNTAKI